MGSHSNRFHPIIGFSPRRILIQSLLGACLVSTALSSVAFSQSKNPSAPSAPPTAQPGKSDSNSPTSTHSILKQGSQGSEVVELQAMLKLLGYYGGPVNGVYDPSLSIAVTQFQKAAGLSADGIVGSETWNRLLPPTPVVQSTGTASQPTLTTSEVFPAPTQSKPTAPVSTKKPVASNPATTKPADGESAATPKKTEIASLPILRLGMQGSAVSGLQERLRALGFLKGAADGIFGTETREAVKAAQHRFSLEPDGIVGLSTWIALLR